MLGASNSPSLWPLSTSKSKNSFLLRDSILSSPKPRDEIGAYLRQLGIACAVQRRNCLPDFFGIELQVAEIEIFREILCPKNTVIVEDDRVDISNDKNG